MWNQNLGNNLSKVKGGENLKVPYFDEYDLQSHKLFHYGRINAPLVKLGKNNLAVFNFPDDVIELMDSRGKIYKSVPVSFHKEEESNLLASIVSALVPVSEWKWRGKILVDDYYRNVYTTFQKNGMVQLRKIDLETGKLTSTFDLPFPFPEKIQVYRGDAYFLVKQDNINENWKLVKCRL